MTKKVFLSLILVFFVAMACNSGKSEFTPPIDPDTGKSYFFLVEGKYREYDVYEIRYFGVDISDTSEYQLREEVKSYFLDNQGDTTRIIHRFRRNIDTDPWALDSVWTARIEADRAISIENNRSIVKMTFPVFVGKIWDGNLYNTVGQDTFEIKSFNEFFQLPGSLTSFQKAMVIEHHEDDDLITFRDNRREVYADSVGLVFKEYEVLKYCSTNECLNQQIIQSGRLYRETLIAHGTVEGG